jgi:hypothetical protein
MKKMNQLVAATAITLFAGAASATIIIDNSTTGWYNQGLGDLADTYDLPFFPAENVTEGDPIVNPLAEPDLSSTPALGNWLDGDFTLGSWTGPSTVIPIASTHDYPSGKPSHQYLTLMPQQSWVPTMMASTINVS